MSTHIQSQLAQPSVDELDDQTLLGLVRDGSHEAYASFYRRYAGPTKRFARSLGAGDEAEDVVAEAFARVFEKLRQGLGPERSFAAYLFTAVRHETYRRSAARRRLRPTDDQAVLESAVPFGVGHLDDFDRSVVRAAYDALPVRWRVALWMADVEGYKPRELAEHLGLTPNGASALIYRARSGLREAYLQQHLSADVSDQRPCSTARRSFAAVLLRTATERKQKEVHAHLAACASCMNVYLEVGDLNPSAA
ncbi:MAG: sigma-70 family RNA polymerase sigma factor [Aeromicrobium sp.]